MAIGNHAGEWLRHPPHQLAHRHGEANTHDPKAGRRVQRADEQPHGLTRAVNDHDDARRRERHEQDIALFKGLKKTHTFKIPCKPMQTKQNP